MQLHSFFNSSTSYRVRIALALKGLSYDYLPVNLRKQEQRAADYVAKNPSAGVPLLIDGDTQLSQSLAIIDYLDATHPKPRLIPAGTLERARVLELSDAISCDIHPVNNMRILRYLQDVLGASDEQKTAWYHHWIREGMTAVEALLAQPFPKTPGGRRDRAMLETLYACGLRVSELIGLDTGDLDFDGGYLVCTGKGSKQRLVPFGGEASRVDVR